MASGYLGARLTEAGAVATMLRLRRLRAYDRAVSSAVERSPYKRRVGGSNPSPPTNKNPVLDGILTFLCIFASRQKYRSCPKVVQSALEALCVTVATGCRRRRLWCPAVTSGFSQPAKRCWRSAMAFSLPLASTSIQGTSRYAWGNVSMRSLWRRSSRPSLPFDR